MGANYDIKCLYHVYLGVKMKLNDEIIQSAEPKDKPYRLFDGLGLYIEVAPSGTKAWRVKYRFQGKEKRLSLGIYPDISIELAREKLAYEKELLANGIDPSEERKKEKSIGQVSAHQPVETSADNVKENIKNESNQSVMKADSSTETVNENLNHSPHNNNHADNSSNDGDEIDGSDDNLIPDEIPTSTSDFFNDQVQTDKPTTDSSHLQSQELETLEENEPSFERVIREWHLTLTPEKDPQRVIHLFEEHFIFHLGSLSIKDMNSEHFIDHLTQNEARSKKDSEAIEDLLNYLPDIFLWAKSQGYQCKSINFKYIANKFQKNQKLTHSDSMQGKTMAIALTVLSGLRACWNKSFVVVNSIIQNTRSTLKEISRLGAFKKWGHFNVVKMIFSRLIKAFVNLFMLFYSIISITYNYLFNLLKKTTKVKLKPSFSVNYIFRSLKNRFTSIQLNSLNPKSMILGASNYFSSHKKILIIVLAIIAGLITSVVMFEKPAESPKLQTNDELLVQSPVPVNNSNDHIVFSRNFGFNQNKIDLKSDLEAKKIVETINSENKPIQIIGYADARGSRLYNLNLAHNRAMEAYKSLISIGLEAYLVDSIHASSPLESATCLEEQCLDFMKFEIIHLK
jgi:hypothetical protein